MPGEGIQLDVFHLGQNDPCASFSFVENNQISEALLENCTAWETFDYFEGSGAAYKATLVMIGIYSVLLLAVILVGVMLKQGRLTLSKRSKLNASDSTYGLAGDGVVRIFAEELKVSCHSSVLPCRPECHPRSKT